MMCEGCTAGEHWRCGMQTWCECDCAGPDGNYFDEIDPDAGLVLVEESDVPERVMAHFRKQRDETIDWLVKKGTDK